jgi:hypothetical protein
MGIMPIVRWAVCRNSRECDADRLMGDLPCPKAYHA